METSQPVVNDRDLALGPLSRFSVTTSPVDDSAISILATSLLVMSGIVLLVASLNLANMQLARAGARRKEFAIRLAIGGSRFRLVRQLITEGLMLSCVGGAVALFIAWAAMRALLGGMSGLLPILMNIDPAPDWRIFVATMIFAVAGTLMSSLGPALASARADVLPELKENAGEMKNLEAAQVRHQERPGNGATGVEPDPAHHSRRVHPRRGHCRRCGPRLFVRSRHPHQSRHEPRQL